MIKNMYRQISVKVLPIVLTSALYCVSCNVAVAQGHPKAEQPRTGRIEGKNYFPGQIPGREIHLLPGYKVETEAGMEGPHGRIWNDSDFTINFSITGQPYGYTEAPDLWTIDQVVSGRHIVCHFKADQNLDVWIPDLGTQFVAKIRNQRDLAEVLLMVVTYQRSKESPSAAKPESR
jgi:hypothetical protein